ncbi:MAG TPA: hypothetical protein VJL39_01520 [Candidatus Paceibacterota bacterium]
MKTLSRLQFLSALVILAVAVVLGTAGIARATLTIAATSLTTDGAFTVTSVAGTDVTMFAANTTGTITIGGTAQTGTFNIGTSTGAMAMNIATGNGAKTVTIASGTGIDTIVIGGGGTAADNIDIGDVLADVDINGASGIVAGTGDALTITANAASTWSTTAGALTITAATTIQIGSATAGLTYYEDTEAVTADNTLTVAESGTTYYVSGALATSTLPAVASSNGVVFRFVVGATLTGSHIIATSDASDIIEGSLIVAGAVVDCAAEDAITFVDAANLGDFVEVRSNGTKWFVTTSNGLASGKITCTAAGA